MRVLICGSRDAPAYWPEVISLVESFPKDTVVIHGGCRGVDKLAAKVAHQQKLKVEEFMADWSKGASAGPLRNQRMIDEGKPDMVYAFSAYFPLSESRGTFDMVTRAEKAGIPTTTIYLKDSANASKNM